MTVTSDGPLLPDLPCRDLVELVTEHLEGALDAVTERRLLTHLADCPSCRDYLAQIRATTGALARLADDDLPPELRARLLSVYRAWRR